MRSFYQSKKCFCANRLKVAYQKNIKIRVSYTLILEYFNVNFNIHFSLISFQSQTPASIQGVHMVSRFATIIIDFDSTIVQVESLEDLAFVALRGRADCEERVKAIADLTNQAMAGVLRFDEALARRVPLLGARREHIDEVVQILAKKITPSLVLQTDFIRANADRIYVVSGGFKEYIVPVVVPLGFKPENVFANEFVFDSQNNIIGANSDNVLAQEDGKTKLLRHLLLPRPRVIIGDGFSDYQLKASGEAEEFFVVTENVYRKEVVPHADQHLSHFHDLHTLV
jgi:D-3-phosphoglycerate dehydrogenase / 2-oxoglutarate reductase